MEACMPWEYRCIGRKQRSLTWLESWTMLAKSSIFCDVGGGQTTCVILTCYFQQTSQTHLGRGSHLRLCFDMFLKDSGVCVCVVMCMWMKVPWSPLESPGVPWSWSNRYFWASELFEVGSGNWTQICCKSSVCVLSHSLNHLSSLIRAFSF